MTAQLDISAMMRAQVRDLDGYEPGMPWDRIARELGLDETEIAKLDSNENPYGPAPLVRERLATAPLNLYPDMEQRAARTAIAAYMDVGMDNVIGGNGSDELIDLVVRLFCNPGDEIMTAPPTFAMYALYARLQGLSVVEVDRRGDDWRLDVDKIEARVGPRTRLIFIAAPNNPTGNPLPREELERLLDLGPVIVVDEAYAEFADEHFAPLAASRPNLVVLRTFSKWGGLAGLRAGYLVADSAVVDKLLVMKSPFNMSLAAQLAAVASLEQQSWLDANAAKIKLERRQLFDTLEAYGGLQPWPSAGNFLLCRLLGGGGRATRDALRRHGVFTRHFETPTLSDCLRITVGRPGDSDRLIAALDSIKAECGA